MQKQTLEIQMVESDGCIIDKDCDYNYEGFFCEYAVWDLECFKCLKTGKKYHTINKTKQ